MPQQWKTCDFQRILTGKKDDEGAADWRETRFTAQIRESAPTRGRTISCHARTGFPENSAAPFVLHPRIDGKEGGVSVKLCDTIANTPCLGATPSRRMGRNFARP